MIQKTKHKGSLQRDTPVGMPHVEPNDFLISYFFWGSQICRLSPVFEWHVVCAAIGERNPELALKVNTIGIQVRSSAH